MRARNWRWLGSFSLSIALMACGGSGSAGLDNEDSVIRAVAHDDMCREYRGSIVCAADAPAVGDELFRSNAVSDACVPAGAGRSQRLSSPQFASVAAVTVRCWALRDLAPVPVAVLPPHARITGEAIEQAFACAGIVGLAHLFPAVGLGRGRRRRRSRLFRWRRCRGWLSGSLGNNRLGLGGLRGAAGFRLTDERCRCSRSRRLRSAHGSRLIRRRRCRGRRRRLV